MIRKQAATTPQCLTIDELLTPRAQPSCVGCICNICLLWWSGRCPYQTASQVESAITGKGYQTAAQVESAITGKGYQTAPQVAAAISAAGHLKRLKVDALPDAGGADAQTIYLVPAEKSDTGNVYDEFMVIDGAWERIGSTQVDLTGYVQEDDLTELGATKVQSIWDSAMAG